MEIIPAIDIRAGRCVRLEQGDYDRETVFADDPVQMASHWALKGATRLHVVDLDGARSGETVNQSIIGEIAKSLKIPVQVGGGIRDEAVGSKYLAELDVDRVVIGTAAVRNPELVQSLCGAWPDRVVVAIDAKDGLVAIEGWTEASTVSVFDLIDRLLGLGVTRILYTDISRDGMLTEPNFSAIRSLIERFPISVIASGGVATVSHLVGLAELGAEAAIVGRALYTGAVVLEEAILATST